MMKRSYFYLQAYRVRAAIRLINYTDSCGFFKKGKNIELYAASALYITLRFKKAPYLLIDFSDKMGVKLFKLARYYLKLVKRFGFQKDLPLIDPSLFIHRYCKMLNLGEKIKPVSMTAIRLIKRMKRDWMCQGRRPSSLCGAAILIACKIHKIVSPNCSTTEICKTVFVCDETIRRRLDEFKKTNVSKLTPEQFENQEYLNDFEGEMDPPAFTKARLRSKNEKQLKKENQLKQKVKWQEEDEVPQEIIKKYSEEIAKKYEQASNRSILHQNRIIGFEEQIVEQNQSNKTLGLKNLDSDSEKQNSDIDEKLIFLNEKQQKQRKLMWEASNRSWFDKQAAKLQRGQREAKKKIKPKKKICDPSSAYEAVKNTDLGQKIDDEELKKLFTNSPSIHQKESNPDKRLHQIFNPFKWNMSS